VTRTVKIDGAIGDIFSLQDQIVYELSQGMQLHLRDSEMAAIERRETASVEAYEHRCHPAPGKGHDARPRVRRGLGGIGPRV
jgi:hypothetical protein